MRFTAQQISEIVEYIKDSSFDTEEMELPEVLVLSVFWADDIDYDDFLFEAHELRKTLLEKFPYVRAETDASVHNWIYIYITHN
jgi:hypothetical protein